MLKEYAEKEMSIAWPESDETQDMIKKDILEVIDVFSNQGHSGMSGAYTLNCLDRLLRLKPLTPLTGADDEWGKPYGFDETQQNKRCSSVFRNRFDNKTAHDIEGKVFSSDGGKTFYSCRDSIIPVTFPYLPPAEAERVILDEKTENGIDRKAKKYFGKSHSEMFEILNTMCRIEDQAELTESEEEAFDIAIQCVATVMNRMIDDKPISWDD
jgi:hypothetical protein